MSHKITQIDTIDSIALEWHKLNRVRGQAELNTFAGGALDWEVARQPAFFSGGELAGNFLTTTAGGRVYPIVAAEDSYTPIQNRELWDIFTILIDEFGFNVECLGSFGGRRKVFVTLSAGESLSADNVKIKLNVISSHDKTTLTQFFTSCVRIVCANTWRLALNSKTEDFYQSLRKTRNVGQRIATVKSALVDYGIAVTEANEAVQSMQSTAIDNEIARQIAAGIINPKGTRGINQVDKIVSLFETGKGNGGNNLYDLFNGFTEYFTHCEGTSKSPEDVWLSSEFGTFAATKARVWQELPSNAEQLAQKGKALLAAI